jgi:hypothetical protein
MKPFRTILPDEEFPFRIRHSDGVLTLGSCFADHLARRLRRGKFQVWHNPFGILYSPLVLAQALDLLLGEKEYSGQDLIRSDGLWHSFDFHGQFSGVDADQVLTAMNESMDQVRRDWSAIRCLVVTLGTAFHWRKRSDQRIVANCHKVPSREFRRELPALESITQSLRTALMKVQDRVPEVQVLLTVSPVRHLRDGLVASRRSKALLLASVHDLVDDLDFVHYFPAYELLEDDLRDYRFYARDRCHPSEEAVDYVWAYAARHLLVAESLQMLQDIDKLHRGLDHRPFHPDAAPYGAFCRQLEDQIKQLETRYPAFSFEPERKKLSQLNNNAQ